MTLLTTYINRSFPNYEIRVSEDVDRSGKTPLVKRILVTCLGKKKE